MAKNIQKTINLFIAQNTLLIDEDSKIFKYAILNTGKGQNPLSLKNKIIGHIPNI